MEHELSDKKFGLRAFPGKVFRFRPGSAYESPQEGWQVTVQVEINGEFVDFSRDSIVRVVAESRPLEN